MARNPRTPRLLRVLPALALVVLTTSNAMTDAAVVQQKLYGLASGLAYYLQVNIGQPLYSASTASTATNKFNLLVDTGSANTAVVTADCCSLTNTALYSCSSSSTCASQDTTVTVSYITGAWSGDLVQDTFSGADIGAITSFPFTEILQESNFIQTGYDGIVGLGYAAIAAPTSKPPTPYFDKIQTTKSLANVFSMLMCGSLQMLTQANATLESESDLYSGELIMGGTEGANGESYYQGELVYTPLVQNKWYNVVVTDLKVANTSLGLDCKAINTPRSIVDSGTSNIAFPSEVYSAVLTQLKTDVRKVIPAATDSFFSDDVPCCSTLCDPTNADSQIYSLPALSISLAVDGKSEQITVSIPPEYIWRPILVSTTTGSARACRVFGISEGDITLLGDVFMDGLFTVHDRENDQLGFGVAKSCPNGVTSSKTVTVESLNSKTSSLCDCVSNSDKKSSLLSSYFPIGSSKPCFFWQWWMYVVVVCVVLIVISIGVVFYISWRRRKLLKELHSIQSQQHSTQQSQQSQRAGSGGLPPRQISGGLERNLLTPSSAMQDSVAPAMTIAIHNNQSSSRSSSSQSLHHSGSNSSISSATGGGYRPPAAPTSLSGSSSSSGSGRNVNVNSGNNNNDHYRASGSPEALHAVV